MPASVFPCVEPCLPPCPSATCCCGPYACARCCSIATALSSHVSELSHCMNCGGPFSLFQSVSCFCCLPHFLLGGGSCPHSLLLLPLLAWLKCPQWKTLLHCPYHHTGRAWYFAVPLPKDALFKLAIFGFCYLTSSIHSIHRVVFPLCPCIRFWAPFVWLCKQKQINRALSLRM